MKLRFIVKMDSGASYTSDEMVVTEEKKTEIQGIMKFHELASWYIKVDKHKVYLNPSKIESVEWFVIEE